MTICELCKFPANTYCESDQASLCWDCDAKVHGANFLVARHVRFLLCQTCQSPTPWRAAGVRLGRNVSVCQRCVEGREKAANEDDEILTDEDVTVENEEDPDNQVVPLSSEVNSPPPASSCSSSAESGGDKEISSINLDKTRENASDLRTQDLLSLMQSGIALANRRSQEEEEAVSFEAMRPMKKPKTERNMSVHISGSTTAAADEWVRSLGSKNLCKIPKPFDLNS